MEAMIVSFWSFKNIQFWLQWHNHTPGSENGLTVVLQCVTARKYKAGSLPVHHYGRSWRYIHCDVLRGWVTEACDVDLERGEGEMGKWMTQRVGEWSTLSPRPHTQPLLFTVSSDKSWGWWIGKKGMVIAIWNCFYFLRQIQNGGPPTHPPTSRLHHYSSLWI